MTEPTPAAEAPPDAMRSLGFLDLRDHPAIEPVPGRRMRTPHGRHLMLSYLEMAAGADVPLHSHPHEQCGVLLAGTLDRHANSPVTTSP